MRIRTFIPAAVAASVLLLLSSCDKGGDSQTSSIAASFGKPTYSVAPSRAVDISLILDKPAEKSFWIPAVLSGDAEEDKDFELQEKNFIFTAGENRATISVRSLNYGETDKTLTIKLGEVQGTSGVVETKSTTVAIAAGDGTEDPNHFYIDNGEVRLGIDMNGGGSVFYYAESSTGRNLLNHADKGRYMQQSYYGDPDGSTWNGGPWVWNPVQGGGTDNTPATVLAYELTENSIWVRSRPKLWATSVDEPYVVMEEEISLDGKVATAKYRFKYTGEHNHGLRAQELPAFFCDLALRNLVSYDGDNPWSGAATYSVQPKWLNLGEGNDTYYTTENWAAYVDNNQWGIGLYFPGTEERIKLTCYGHQGPSGPTGGGCSYFAPEKFLEIVSGFDYRYNVHMTIGNVTDIRARFKNIRDGNAL